ncbi:DNA transposition-like protein, partial [Listeria monocytogenes]|nr:DNA transposition-like protein [Listeria monocytogenes]
VIDKLKGIKTNTLFVTAPATKPSSLSSQLSSLAIDIAHVNEIISSTENKVIPKTDRIDYMATSIDRIVENIFYAVDWFCCKVFQKIYFSVKLRKKTERTE